LNARKELTARCRAYPHGCYHPTVGPTVIHLSSHELNGLERSLGSAIGHAVATPSPCCMMLKIDDRVCLRLSLLNMLNLQQTLLSRKPFHCSAH